MIDIEEVKADINQSIKTMTRPHFRHARVLLTDAISIIEQLQAAIEQLQAENADAEAEKMLSDGKDRLIGNLTGGISKLEAENAELRGALAKIALSSRRNDSPASVILRQVGLEAHVSVNPPAQGESHEQR